MIKKRDLYTLSFMAFGIFFGAGNLIFPPPIAQQAGTNVWFAFFGFFITAVLLPVLGIIAVAKTDGLLNLGKKVDPIFAYIITIGILIAIGPGLAIPRTGSTSFSMAIQPYISDSSSQIMLLIYSIIYFGLVLLVSWSPNKIVKTIGRYTTPSLLCLITIMFLFSLFKVERHILPPSQPYIDSPIAKGFLEGYNTLDTLAALNYGLLIVTAIRNFKINERDVIPLASKSGLIAGILLTFVYLCLTIIGQVGADKVDIGANGADILFSSSQILLGDIGSGILGIIFILACFNTCVGLITSISQFFHSIAPALTYRQYAIILTIWSFAFANIGLDGILKFSVPILVLLYPIAITLIILILTEPIFKHTKLSYRVVTYLVSLISITSSLESMGIKISILSNLFAKLPFIETGLHWILPALILMSILSIYHRLIRIR